MKPIYEWTREEIIEGEVHEVVFADKLKELPEFDVYSDTGLVKRIGDDIDGEQHRTYAYVIAGELQAQFDDGSPVPKRYLKEFANA
jgi:endo-1,4-beta-D-glucanase Y